MVCKRCLYLLLFFWCGFSFAQNNQILYDFNQLPQTLLLNPGAEVDYNKHFGVPFLSNVFVQAGATNKNITYNNIYTDDTSDMLRNIYDQNLKRDDYFEIFQRLEVLNAGFRLRNERLYLSFGMYQEIDGYSSYPNEIVDLFYNGDFDKDGEPLSKEKFNFNDANFIGELVGVFHFGLSAKVSDRLNLGARFKLLSGSLNINSVDNKGHYILKDKNPLIFYDHQFEQMGVSANTSGFLNKEGLDVLGSFTEVVSGLFFADGNIGFGIDLGLTYHASDNVIITASLLDLDYIRYTNKATTFQVNKDFSVPLDEPFKPTVGSEFSYWEDVLDLGDFEESSIVPIEVFDKKYNFNRSPKFNASAKYQIIRSNNEKYNSVYRNSKYVTPVNRVLLTEFGLQTYMAFRPDKLVWAVTPFVSTDINRYLTAKFTYTYNEYSAKNIGLGISTHFKSFNFYVAADNLLDLPKWKDSNYQSVQLGMNFMFY